MAFTCNIKTPILLIMTSRWTTRNSDNFLKIFLSTKFKTISFMRIILSSPELWFKHTFVLCHPYIKSEYLTNHGFIKFNKILLTQKSQNIRTIPLKRHCIDIVDFGTFSVVKYFNMHVLLVIMLFLSERYTAEFLKEYSINLYFGKMLIGVKKKSPIAK